MNPIYNDCCKFIYDKCGLELEEGYYWLDNQIIKSFDKQGDIHKVHRLKTEDNLEMSFATYKKEDLEMATWQDIMDLNKDRLNDLESHSIRLLQQYGLNTDRKIIDTNSTGKDSEVKTYLAKKAGLEFETYFNCTTLDVKDSNVMAKEKGYKFTYPDKKYGGFYQWVKRENVIPSRLNRACCTYFKEDATIKQFNADDKLLLLFGMRNDESNSRSRYEDVWVNNKWGNRDWLGILPIRHWTDLDIWLYMLREGIDINQKYKKGYDRVGCAIACPNYSKSTWVLDEYWYPKMFDRWRNTLKEDFVSNSKWLIMNCTLEEYVQKAWNGGVYRTEPTEEVVTEYATYNELDVEIARKYFSKRCSNGCINNRSKDKSVVKIKHKDVIAMNIKLFGRHIEKFQCKKCLMKEFGWTKDVWNNKVIEFKEQGCKLF